MPDAVLNRLGPGTTALDAQPVDYRDGLRAVIPGAEQTLPVPTLRDDQYNVAVHPAKTKVLACGRRWGKSTLGLILLFTTLLRGGKVAWIVPTYKNGNALWRMAERAVGGLRVAGAVRVNRSDRTIELPAEGGFFGIYSAENADAIRGEWFNLVILDEAARIAEDVWTDVIQPTLADVDGDAVLLSTPKGHNWFWREWQRGQTDGTVVKSFRAPSSANPNPRIRDAAEKAKTRVPPNTFRQEWEAEFVNDGSLIYSAAWWDGHNRYDATSQGMRNQVLARWLSWDTAMKDKDTSAYSALTVGELMPDYRLLTREVWRDKLNFPDLISVMQIKAAEYNLDRKLRGVIIEDRASGTSAYQTLVSSVDRDLAALIIPFEPQGSKIQRANQAAVWCKNGAVLLPYPSAAVPWLLAFEEELYSFADSEYKDQGDSFAQLILYLENYLAAGHAARTGQQEQPVDEWAILESVA